MGTLDKETIESFFMEYASVICIPRPYEAGNSRDICNPPIYKPRSLCVCVCVCVCVCNSGIDFPHFYQSSEDQGYKQGFQHRFPHTVQGVLQSF